MRKVRMPPNGFAAPPKSKTSWLTFYDQKHLSTRRDHQEIAARYAGQKDVFISMDAATARVRVVQVVEIP